MKLHHVALWTRQLEPMKDFYVRYFGATQNDKYASDKGARGRFEPYFLTFDTGAQLELMTLPAIGQGENEGGVETLGLTHFAFSVESRDAFDDLYHRLIDDQVNVASAPRTTGDGYYETCILDPNGNRIEITVLV